MPVRPGRQQIFCVDNGRIIRLAQKCDVIYGEQVRVFEVDVLTRTDYAEHEIPESPILNRSGSGWNALGMHQYDPWWTGSQWICAVDGCNTNYAWSIGIYVSEPSSPPSTTTTIPITCATDNDCAVCEKCDDGTCVFQSTTEDTKNECDTVDCYSGFCNGNGACGVKGAGEVCTDDGNFCTNDICNGSGTCTHPNNIAPCDDSDPCTENDICNAGTCAGTLIDCDDGNVCTNDSCDPVLDANTATTQILVMTDFSVMVPIHAVAGVAQSIAETPARLQIYVMKK